MGTTETVTVLFTDVVASTALLDRLGPEAAERARQDHVRALRHAVEITGGREVKNVGDGLMVAFTSAASAVRCGVEMQRRVAALGESASLRVGIATGDADVDGNDLFGRPVVESARLCAAATGGQILASDLVCLLAGGRGGHEYESIGDLALKGFEVPVPVREVQWTPGPSSVPVPEADQVRELMVRGRTAADAGDPVGARSHFQAAADAARTLDDPDLLVEAACALAGDAQWLAGDAAVEAVLERALVHVGDDPAHRSAAGRISARLALVRSIRADPRTRADAERSLRLSSEDRTVALFAWATSSEGPDDVDARAEAGDALLTHGRDHDDPVAVAYGHLYRGLAALDRGAFSVAATERRLMVEVAAGTTNRHLAAQAADTAYLSSLIAGRVEEAETLAVEVRDTWARAAEPGVAWLAAFSARMFVAELTTGFDEGIAELEAINESMPGEVAWRVGIAHGHACAGRAEDARAVLDQLRSAELRGMPRGAIWMGSATGLAFAATSVGDQRTAALAAELLGPYVDQQAAIAGLGYRGAVAHWLGLCRLTLGDAGSAVDLLRRALGDHRAADSPQWVASSATGLARALLADGGDRTEAAALLAEARVLADDRGFVRLGREARAVEFSI